MALTIGELVGFIRFDASGADQGAADAENRMRQVGQNVSDDAQRAGQQAGQALGHGLSINAEGAISDAEGNIVAHLRTIGDEGGEGLSEGAGEGGEQAASKITEALGKVKGLLIGGAIGAALIEGFGGAMEQGAIVGKLQAQLGATPAQAQKYGKIAGQLYAAGVTDDFETAAEAIKSVMSAGILPPDASNAQIRSITTNVQDLANTFDQDLGGVTNAVSQMLRTGLAKNGKEALDILTKGFQSSANKADDLLDTFNEYGTQFRKAGIDGQTAVGLMNQAIQAGARDSDLAADAIKEFSIRAVDGSTTTKQGFKSLGLSATDMADKFGKGGKSATAALDTTLDRLRKIKDPVKQAQIATELFGTQAEDLGKALFAMDPSTAAKGLGKVGGAADKMGKDLRDNAQARVTAFKRTLQQDLINVMGTRVVPLLLKVPGAVKQVGQAFQTAGQFIDRNKATFITIAGVVTTILLPSLVTMATTAVTSAASSVTAWVTQAGAAISTGATYVGVNALIVAGWIKQAVQAGIAAARTVAAWVLMGAQSMLQAARMAAAWLLAMGPIPLIIAAVVGLVVLIVKNWDTIKQWTAAAWDWVWNKIKEVGQFIVNWFMNWTLPGLILSHWDSIKAGAQAAWDWVKNAIMTVVNAIVSFAQTTFTSLKNLIESVWNGIKSVSSTVWNAIKTAISAVWSGIKAVVQADINLVKSVVSGAWNTIKSVTSSVWNGIKSTISSLINGAKNAVSSAINAIKGFFSSGFSSAKNTVSNAISGVVSTIKGLSGKVKSAVSGAASWLVNAGKSIIQGLINGITSMAGKVVDAVKGVLKKARDYLPFSPAKRGPFAGRGWTLFSGRAIVESLAKGIEQRKQALSNAAKAAMEVVKRHQVALATRSTPFQTGQQVQFSSSGQELAGVQNGYGGKMLHIENYYESESGSAQKTATELEWLAKARG